jgi:hypothetical protein
MGLVRILTGKRTKINNIEKFQLMCDEKYIYFDNPSPIMLVQTREWLTKELGAEIEYYGPSFFPIVNSLKIAREKESLFREKILPFLTFDGKFYFHKDSLNEGCLI